VLAALPKSAHPGAKKALAEIYNAEDKGHAVKAAKAFADDYGTKWPKAAASTTSHGNDSSPPAETAPTRGRARRPSISSPYERSFPVTTPQIITKACPPNQLGQVVSAVN
jgi:hypothetical protein